MSCSRFLETGCNTAVGATAFMVANNIVEPESACNQV